MLQAIRDRAQGVFAWFMLIAIGVPFALWGIQNYIGSGKEEPAAVVGGHEIFDRDVNRAYEQSIAALVGVADYDEKQVRRQALERLIREELIYQQALDQSLAVSDDELRAFIQTLPYFQSDGKFDKDKYKTLLSAQRISPSQFSEQIRRALLMEQYQRGFSDSALVIPEQVDLLLRLKNQEREIDYTIIPLKPSTKTFDESEIEAYYRQHAEDFKNPEKVSIEYIVLDLSNLAKTVTVSEDELRNYYETQKSSFGTEERRKLSHILIPVEGDDATAGEAALKKINELRERLTVGGEDFATVASANSGDGGSAKQGGDIGFFTQSTLEQSFGPEAATATFALKPGEISAPIKTRYGYHLIKLTELVPADIKPYEQVRDELRQMYQRNAAETKFYELGQTLTEQSYEHPDSLEPAAKKLGLAIETTPLFTRDAGDGIAADEKVRAAAFSEEVLSGRNSDPVELGNERALVLRLKDHVPASEKPLAEVHDVIVARLQADDARRVASKRADQLSQELKSGKPFKDVAATNGLNLTRSPAFRRGFDKLPAELVNAAFQAGRPGAGAAPVGTVPLANGEYAVFQLVAVKDGDPATIDAQERESAKAFLAKTEGQREFAALIGQLRETASVRIKSEP